MKAVLTCDDVFDILTRKPFPSGDADDEIVESHLAVCHECRQLAEAFRPAVGLFHESLSAECDDQLPMYRGRLKPIVHELSRTTLVAAPRAASSQSRRRHRSMRGAMAIAASLVVAAAVVAALAVTQQSNGTAPLASGVRVLPERDYTTLAALEIPSSCRALLESSDRALAEEFVCCTKCHHAVSRVASTNLAIMKTSAACAACHDRMLGESLSLAPPHSNQLCEALLACAPIRSL